MNTATFLLLIVCTVGRGHAAPRASASYHVTAEIVDAGGQRATSASYTQDSSVGMVSGISTAAVPAAMAKHGYLGQLYDITGLALNAAPLTIDEAGTAQLSAWQLLDDATFLAVNANTVIWSVLAGPLANISISGLATAGFVFQDTVANVQGSFEAFTASLNLTVLDSIPDNFDSYAGDEIGDEWQVQYFGLPPNPLAAPLLDPDGDGQNNRFEYVAGLNPTDTNSTFRLRIERSFQGAHLVFGPIVSGRTYTVTYRPDVFVLPPWPALPPGLPTFQNGTERTVIDTGAQAAPQRFYRVEISK